MRRKTERTENKEQDELTSTKRKKTHEKNRTGRTRTGGRGAMSK